MFSGWINPSVINSYKNARRVHKCHEITQLEFKCFVHHHKLLNATCCLWWWWEIFLGTFSRNHSGHFYDALFKWVYSCHSVQLNGKIIARERGYVTMSDCLAIAMDAIDFFIHRRPVSAVRAIHWGWRSVSTSGHYTNLWPKQTFYTQEQHRTHISIINSVRIEPQLLDNKRGVC